jgi:hypothetical protein
LQVSQGHCKDFGEFTLATLIDAGLGRLRKKK